MCIFIISKHFQSFTELSEKCLNLNDRLSSLKLKTQQSTNRPITTLRQYANMVYEALRMTMVGLSITGVLRLDIDSPLEEYTERNIY